MSDGEHGAVTVGSNDRSEWGERGSARSLLHSLEFVADHSLDLCIRLNINTRRAFVHYEQPSLGKNGSGQALSRDNGRAQPCVTVMLSSREKGAAGTY